VLPCLITACFDSLALDQEAFSSSFRKIADDAGEIVRTAAERGGVGHCGSQAITAALPMHSVQVRLQAALEDRYRVGAEIGAGGMALVYRAVDLKHGRDVAVKVLRSELAHAVGADRFLREIATTATLRHPNILPLFDSGEADGILYYVMPLVQGESLRDRLDREGRLSIDDALRITTEVADALGCARERGIAHRDINPENILLERGHAVVADFGIACAMAATGNERLTQTGFSVGTPTYMSPEQAVGEQNLDGRSDLYSLGCVLYEMLAGQPPFTGSSAVARRSRLRCRLYTRSGRSCVIRRCWRASASRIGCGADARSGTAAVC